MNDCCYLCNVDLTPFNRSAEQFIVSTFSDADGVVIETAPLCKSCALGTGL
jgi:hypothetical protein